MLGACHCDKEIAGLDAAAVAADPPKCQRAETFLACGIDADEVLEKFPDFHVAVARVQSRGWGQL